MTEQNYRESECRFDSDGWRFDSDGSLDATIFITRPGVFDYYDPILGRNVKELRSRAEVHKQSYLDQYLGRPLTNNHPTDKAGKRRMVSLDTIRQDMSGSIYGPHEISEDGIHTKAKVRVYDAKTIQDIVSGKRKVSAGFYSDTIEKPGIDPEFGEYERELVNFTANHVSVVWSPRVGHGAEIRADEDESQMTDDQQEIPNKQEVPEMETKKMVLDGAEFDLPEAAAVAVAKLQTANEALQAKYDAAQEEIAAVKAVDVNSLVAERIDLLEKARKIAPEGKFDGLDNAGIMAAALTGKNLEGKSQDYIAARFDAAFEIAIESSNVPEILANLGSRMDSADPIEAARQKQINEMYKG